MGLYIGENKQKSMPVNPDRLRQVYITKGKIRSDVSYVMWDLCSRCNGTSLPIPEPDELQDDFINRCMNDRVMSVKHEDEFARMAASNLLWSTRASICKLSPRCQYIKKGFCSVESNYLNAITKPVLKLLDEKCEVRLTELDWQDFGLKVVPLYHDLIRVKKEKAALDRILIESAHGVKVHPLFKEMRDIIRAIDSLEITRILKDKFKEMGIKDVTPATGPSIEETMEQDGDPGFADSLMKTGGEEEGATHRCPKCGQASHGDSDCGEAIKGGGSAGSPTDSG